jgi:non-heme chloroperoxidase
VARAVTLAGGLTLSCEVRGDGGSRPPLVLLPGPTDSWLSYRPVLDLLPSSARAVAVTQRGHGDSDKPATGYGVEDFAGDVPLLLDALAIEEAVLVGHSGSCLVARCVAIQHPDRIAGLVLESSPLTLRGDPGLIQFVGSVVSGLRDPIDADFARGVVTDTSSPTLAPELVDRLVSEVLAVPAAVWRETFAALLHYDDLEALPSIDCPALLLWGDGDTSVSSDAQEELLRRLPNASLVVHRGAGHTPRWEDPARVAADLVGFLERLSGAR